MANWYYNEQDKIGKATGKCFVSLIVFAIIGIAPVYGYVLNTNTKKVHTDNCNEVAKIKEENKQYCPMEDAARCVLNFTPRFAKIVSEKYACMGAPAVQRDLASTLRRSIPNSPIGSGVTEAACKVVVKQRLCVSGARWSERGSSVVLSLRTLVLSQGHWDAFWKKYMQYGSTI